MRQRGFTLIELLTVITITAIMVGIAVPSFKNFLATQRVKSASSEISMALLLARSEAAKRGRDVTITPAVPNTWTAGWTVTTVQATTTITLHTQTALDGIDITRAPASITFQASGRPAASGLSYWQVAGIGSTRCIRLDTAGTASTSKEACPV